MGALMIGFIAPATAQVDNKATIDAISKVIIANPASAKDEVKKVYKKNKKNPEVLTGIGRAYLDAKDVADAEYYGQLAIKVDKHYGPGYVLLGDVEVAKDNGGAASAWFEQATMMDPKNVDGYRRYAQVNSKVSPSASVAKLEELRKNVPDYPVDIISAEIYDKAGNISKAIEYYKKVDLNKMEDYQLASFATDYYLKGEFQKSLEISQFGNKKFPRYAGLNRLTFYNETDLKHYPEAIKAAEALFANSDKLKTSENDYLYYGHAYMGVKDYDNAIKMFEKTIEANPENDAAKSDALKNISAAYQEKGDFAKATETYDKYLKSLKQITALDYNTLANMYMDQAEKATGQAQVDAYMKADAVFADMVEKFPSAADFATYQRAHIGYNLDPETKTGAAKPHYEKLIEIIKGHATKGDHDDSRLVEAYRYLGYYYLLKDDKATADTYWNKVLEIEPDNATAKQALGIK